MTETFKTITFEVKAYQDNKTKKWQGVVTAKKSNDALVYGDLRGTEDQAIQSAYRALYKSMSCSHNIKFDTSGQPYPIDCDAAGNEIYGYHAICDKCGYVDSFEYTERDRYHL